MSTFYVVKSEGTATERNKNFAGETSTCYFGKDCKMLGREGTHCADSNFDFRTWMLNEYGYRRKQDARRSWLYKANRDTEFWKYAVSIIPVEV